MSQGILQYNDINFQSINGTINMLSDVSLTGNLSILDNEILYLDTAKTQYIVFNPSDYALKIIAPQDFYITNDWATQDVAVNLVVNGGNNNYAYMWANGISGDSGVVELTPVYSQLLHHHGTGGSYFRAEGSKIVMGRAINTFYDLGSVTVGMGEEATPLTKIDLTAVNTNVSDYLNVGSEGLQIMYDDYNEANMLFSPTKDILICTEDLDWNNSYVYLGNNALYMSSGNGYIGSTASSMVISHDTIYLRNSNSLNPLTVTLQHTNTAAGVYFKILDSNAWGSGWTIYNDGYGDESWIKGTKKTAGTQTIKLDAATGDVEIIDNGKIKLGTGVDSEIYYDGTYLQVSSKIVAPSDIKIDCGTDKTIELVETVWEDLRTPGMAVGVNVTAPDLIAFGPSGNLIVYGFNGAGTTPIEQVYFQIQLPHNYKQGTDIKPHVHWTPTDANAGNVKWQMEYSWQNVDGTFGAPTTISGTGAAGGTAWVHNIIGLTDITGTGMNISSILVCRFFRDPGDGADTYGSDAAFISFDIHYEIDTIGSRQPFVK